MDNLIIGYQILNDECTDGLAGQVRDAIDEGWQPIGGVCVTSVTTQGWGDEQITRIFFYQAMVKYETA